tara:strand:- start:525 stop:764 length:240 start_codon:yes stop_codon:yes gene_type:complete
LLHQNIQDLRVIIKLEKKPANIKNNGIRHIWINSNRIFIEYEELLSEGQIDGGIPGMYGRAACRSIPKTMAIPLKASRP